MRYLAG